MPNNETENNNPPPARRREFITDTEVTQLRAALTTLCSCDWSEETAGIVQDLGVKLLNSWDAINGQFSEPK